MKRMLTIALLAVTTVAHAQTAGFTLQQVQFMDRRYWRTTNAFDAGLTTSTVFGASGNVSGFYDTLTYTETDPVFGPWLASFSATNVPGATYSADTTTITNNGSGQFSVKNYDTNAAAILFYAINNRKTWDDMQAGIRAATWDEMKSSPFAATWDDMK